MISKMMRGVFPAHIKLAREFAMFGAVGAIGFFVNIAAVYGLRGAVGLYHGGLLAWFLAASVTWYFNRRWTFRDRASGQLHRQWALFLLVNSLGFALYYATFASLVTYSGLCAIYPAVAVLIGTLIGMLANFTLSRKFVFCALARQSEMDPRSGTL